MLMPNDISAGKAYTYGTGIYLQMSYGKLPIFWDIFIYKCLTLIFWDISMIPAGAAETTPRHTCEDWQK